MLLLSNETIEIKTLTDPALTRSNHTHHLGIRLIKCMIYIGEIVPVIIDTDADGGSLHLLLKPVLPCLPCITSNIN